MTALAACGASGRTRRPGAWSLVPWILVLAAAFSAPAGALVIHVDAPALAGSPALAAFERAARAWEGVFSDPIQVNISADLRSLGSPLVIGQTSALTLAGSYDGIRDALVLDALDEPDDGVVAFLPTGSQFSAIVLAGLSPNLGLTKANAKALGFDPGLLDATFGFFDATMAFNAAFGFDFDRSDGIAPGLLDFQTVAAHEIGHALGFVSGVDDYAAQGTLIDVLPRTLDLFRFERGREPRTPAEFTSAPRLLVPGLPSPGATEDAFPAVFTDLDAVYELSTGARFGDGRQASHWKDDALAGSLLGIMDPTLTFGQAIDIGARDVRALDVIGWDFDPVVAEPATLLLLALALPLAMRRRKLDALASREGLRGDLVDVLG